MGRALIYRDGPAEQAVPEFCRLVGADTVHITEDFAPWGRERDARVEKALAAVEGEPPSTSTSRTNGSSVFNSKDTVSAPTPPKPASKTRSK